MVVEMAKLLKPWAQQMQMTALVSELLNPGFTLLSYVSADMILKQLNVANECHKKSVNVTLTSECTHFFLIFVKIKTEVIIALT